MYGNLSFDYDLLSTKAIQQEKPVTDFLRDPAFIKLVHKTAIQLLRKHISNRSMSELDKALQHKTVFLQCGFARTNIRDKEFRIYYSIFTHTLLQGKSQLNDASSFYEHCEYCLRRMFPLSIPLLISFLKENNSVYWSLLLPHLQKTVRTVCLGHNCISEADSHDICSDTVEIFRKQIQQGSFPSNILTGERFNFYIAGIARNKIYEFLRKEKGYTAAPRKSGPASISEQYTSLRRKSHISLDRIDISDDTDNPQEKLIKADEKKINTYLQNVKKIAEIRYIHKQFDLEDKSHLQMLVVAMLEKDHPLHRDFVDILHLNEDAIEVLKQRTAGLSYKEIVLARFVSPPDEKTLEREIDKLKHQKIRLVDTLVSRLKKILLHP